jgi:hypothetical protein
MKPVWITARKVRIPLREMTTSHIKNCINCFNGLGQTRIPPGYNGGKEKWLTLFRTELTARHEILD